MYSPTYKTTWDPPSVRWLFDILTPSNLGNDSKCHKLVNLFFSSSLPSIWCDRCCYVGILIYYIPKRNPTGQAGSSKNIKERRVGAVQPSRLDASYPPQPVPPRAPLYTYLPFSLPSPLFRLPTYHKEEVEREREKKPLPLSLVVDDVRECTQSLLLPRDWTLVSPVLALSCRVFAGRVFEFQFKDFGLLGNVPWFLSFGALCVSPCSRRRERKRNEFWSHG